MFDSVSAMTLISTSLTRRNFLRVATGMGLAIGLDGIFPVRGRSSVPQNAIAGDNIIDLHVRRSTLTIGDRETSQALTINDTIPGPLVRLREGETATINVTNHLDVDTSIHWHGIILPAEMDGVPGLSFAGIKPGETFTYQFPVNQSGTYWYHSHSGLQEQLGHFGPLIVDPAEPDPVDYDRDYVVMLSDWTFEDPHQVLRNLKRMAHYYNYQQRTIDTLGEDWDWRRMRMDPTDIADVTGATYTYLTNGKTAEDNWTGIFTPGEKVRLRFINAAAMTFFDIRIPGLKMTVVQADGQNVQPVTVDEFRIAIAETYDVIVEPEDDRAYTIFAETMDRSGYTRGTLAPQPGMSAPIPPQRTRPVRSMADMGMMHGMMEMEENSSQQEMSEMEGHSHHHHGSTHSGHSQHEMSDMPEMEMHGPDDHGPGNAGVPMMVSSRLHEPGIGLENTPDHRVLLYTDLRSLNPAYDRREPEREIELHLTGNMERYMWSFDGKKFSEVEEVTFYNGERLRLTLVNDTMMEHPIHLHGMWMELDNGAGEYKPRKHVINVKPAEKLSADITVDAPGKWAFHCHLMYHMKAGMFRTVAVVDRPNTA